MRTLGQTVEKFKYGIMIR